MAAALNSRTLFLTTSPRTPDKMIPEIELIINHFEGKPWNNENQRRFMEILREEDFFHGKGEKNPDLSARDRINRGPKSLGLVTLSPVVKLSPAGEKLLSFRLKDEVLLRQLLKFQIPSPYHKPSKKAAAFCVKPYLEILRLVRELEPLRFDELQIFGMQLTDYHDFDLIVSKIRRFRIEKESNKGNYRIFKRNYLIKELLEIFSENISRGDIKIRENKEKSLKKFLDTKVKNLRDYADACFRYLRFTRLVNVSHVGKSLSIVPERIKDVDYILENIDRDPIYVNDYNAYVNYLTNPSVPFLLSDDRSKLEERILMEFPDVPISESASIDDLKELLAEQLDKRREKSLDCQVADIKEYKKYDDIQKLFNQIEKNEIYDSALILEWNTWRAMTMIDGGNIKANLKFDDYGKPMSTAAGNMADIVCDYGDYLVSVEVTMQRGQKQYETEGEPVTRHLGKLRKNSGKPCYCLFIAPSINDACVSYFYTLHKTNLAMYGGTSTIVPLPINVFSKMVEKSHTATYKPNSQNVRRFFEKSNELADKCTDEKEWYEQMKDAAEHWV